MPPPPNPGTIPLPELGHDVPMTGGEDSAERVVVSEIGSKHGCQHDFATCTNCKPPEWRRNSGWSDVWWNDRSVISPGRSKSPHHEKSLTDEWDKIVAATLDEPPQDVPAELPLIEEESMDIDLETSTPLAQEQSHAPSPSPTLPSPVVSDSTLLDSAPEEFETLESGEVVLFYEIKTQDADPWNYSEVGNFRVCTHGSKIDENIGPTLEGLPLPAGHPLWYKLHNIPLVRQHFTIEFDGTLDNHPLCSWDNELIPHILAPFCVPVHLRELHVKIVKAINILRNAFVNTDDWVGQPESLF